MPEESTNTDISYQPKQKGYSFKKQKRSFSDTFSLSLSTLKAPSMPTLYLILSIFFLLLSTVFILNYFNFLPVSNMFPKTLGFLPHVYNFSASEKALEAVQFSEELNGYYLEGSLVDVKNDKVAVLYKGRAAEFILGEDLSCEEEITRSLPNGDEQLLNAKAFCNELLKNKYKNKQVTITYQKVQNFYVLRSIAIRVN